MPDPADGDLSGDLDSSMARWVSALAPSLGPLAAAVQKRAVFVLCDGPSSPEALAYFKLSLEDLPAARLVDVAAQR